MMTVRRAGPLTGQRLSWSQIHQLAPDYELACPRQWAYQRVLRLPTTGSVAMYAGGAVDAGLTALLAARMKRRKEDRAIDLAKRAGRDRLDESLAALQEPLHEEQAAAYGQLVETAIEHFARERGRLVPAAVQTEHAYTVRQRDGALVTVVGWSDRIDKDGVVVDHKFSGVPRWKNGGDEWDEAWVRERRDQLCLYWLARRAERKRGEGRRTPVVPRARLEVIYAKVGLRTPQLRALELEFGPEDEERALEAVRTAYETVRDGRLPARPGPACRWCSFRDRCVDDEKRRGLAFVDLVGLKRESAA
jgi:hypothetical protein